MSISISLAGAQSSKLLDFDNQCAADLSWYFHFWAVAMMLPGLLLDERVITGAPASSLLHLRSQLQCIRSLLYGCWACSNNIGDC